MIRSALMGFPELVRQWAAAAVRPGRGPGTGGWIEHGENPMMRVPPSRISRRS